MTTTLPESFILNKQILRAVDDPHAVYIHVPFCHHRCAYCDFNIYADQPALHEAYVQRRGRGNGGNRQPGRAGARADDLPWRRDTFVVTGGVDRRIVDGGSHVL